MERPCVQPAHILLLCSVVSLPATHPSAITQLPDSTITRLAHHQITKSPDHQIILEQLVLEGATVYSREDVLWLLHLREGAPLPNSATEIAKSLQDRYAHDGYTEARVEAQVDGGRLTLRVDEGRIDEIQMVGLEERQATELRDRLDIKPGDVYNKRTVGQAITRLLARTQGAIKAGAGEATMERRGGRSVLVIPLQWRRSRLSFGSGTEGREDLFSPVDGFSPALEFTATIFDHGKFNHAVIDGYASYKFGREDPGYSLGGERPLFGGPRLFVGGELHDISGSDDLWRVSTTDQTLASLAFKNTFRDYYRRRGAQLFGVLQGGPNNEFTLMARWDRHEPLLNATDFSFFRDDATFRMNPPVDDQRVHTWIIGYTFDTRPMTGAGEKRTYERHLRDNLFGFGLRQQPGLRLEWSSELAGHRLGGDARFDRHIMNLRGYLAFSDRQLFAARGIVGVSNGVLPIERRFALGGIGTVHGYAFKETVGTGMALVNAEYRVRLLRGARYNRNGLAVFGFYDAGRVTGPLDGSSTDWLQGTGFGVGISGIRVEFGFRANDIPRSRQVLVRLGPTF